MSGHDLGDLLDEEHAAGMDQSRVYQILTEFQQTGLVEKHDSDGYGNTYVVTEAGREALREYHEWIGKRVPRIKSEEEASVLRGLHEGIRRALTRVSATPSPRRSRLHLEVTGVPSVACRRLPRLNATLLRKLVPVVVCSIVMAWNLTRP